MKKVTCFAGLVALALAWVVYTPDARASVLISNLDGNDGTQSAALSDTRVKGMGFTMPGGLDYFLDSATLRLETFSAGMIPVIQIWSDAGGVPGTLLITLDNPAFNPSGIANYDFTPGSSFTLSANTTYWLVASGVAGAPTYDWKASSPGQTPTGLATHAGAVWGTGGLPPTGSSSILNSYAINATIVPAPAAGLALAGLGLMRRRRR